MRRGKQTRTTTRSCRGKMAHDTWEAANEHINRLVALGSNKDQLVAYPCKKCGKKHVGHRIDR